MSDDHDPWLDEQSRREQIEEQIEELELRIELPPLTDGERNLIAIALGLLAAVQLALGDAPRAYRSTRLARRLRDGADE